MSERVYVCHKCAKRIGTGDDYVIVGEKHERGTEDREHVECNEQNWQKMLAAQQKLPTPGKGGF